jgi:hypothetical protein
LRRGPFSAVPSGLGRPLKSNPGLASWAKFSRPCGTKLVNRGCHTRSKAPEVRFSLNDGLDTGQASLRVHNAMHIECGRAHIRLAEHYMHLAAMMRLVIEEMKDSERSGIPAVLAQAICVAE